MPTTHRRSPTPVRFYKNLSGFAGELGGSRFATHGFANRGEGCLDAANLIADTYKEHRLMRVFQDVDYGVGVVFEVYIFAVGDEVEVRSNIEELTEALADVFLEEADDAADLLKREAFTAEFGDDGNLEDFFSEVEAAMTFLPGRDHLFFVPPLQLAEAGSGKRSYVGRGKGRGRHE